MTSLHFSYNIHQYDNIILIKNVYCYNVQIVMFSDEHYNLPTLYMFITII